MSKVIAGITTSVDGYFVGADDRQGQGLGLGGERLHYWVSPASPIDRGS